MQGVPTFLFAGGGSGGHISPALAVAEQLDDAARVIHVCSDRAIDREMLGAASATFVALPARPPSPRPAAAMRFLLGHRRSVQQCSALITRERVTHVVAFGGFVSVPAVVAAQRLGIPRTLINLDRPPGRANRWLAGRATEIWSAVAIDQPRAFADRVVGLPLRRVVTPPADMAACRIRLDLDPDRPVLLITGASQGARSLNELMMTLVLEGDFPAKGWQVLHLSGAGTDRSIAQRYEEAGVTARVIPFLDEMGLAWGAAELAVSRARANTVAEIVAAAVPTLFLPYPYHRDRHQHGNAAPLVDAGGAVVVDDLVDPARNARHVRPILEQLMTDADQRGEMRRRLAARTDPDAAERIASLLIEAAGRHAHPVEWNRAANIVSS